MSKDLYWPGEKKVDWEAEKAKYNVSPYANFGLFALVLFWMAVICEGIAFTLAI